MTTSGAVDRDMMHTWMVPLDGSPVAEQALPWAAALARAAHGALHLVHVRPSLPLTTDPASEDYMQRLQQDLESELPGRITSALVTYQPGALMPVPPGAEGTARTLLQHAADQNVSAIVMTSHGRGGLRRASLGNVAVDVLRHSLLPVLLLRPDTDADGNTARANRGIAHIVVPLDGSDVALTALKSAYELGRPFNAQYTLLTVAAPVPWSLSTDAHAHAPIAYPAFDRPAAEDALESAAAQLRNRDARADVALLDEWPPDNAILNYAARHGVDAIVLATRAVEAFGRLLTTSIADRLIRGAGVPVLCCNSARMPHPDNARAEATGIAQAYIPLS
jgi:nucleotide-binding universal stress UspA family protein